jgi:hypothetical protein
MRHCVRRNWQAWSNIGTSGQVFHWVREGVTIPFLNNRPRPPFKQDGSLLDATPEQLTFVHAELARFVETGAWEPTTCSPSVSILFSVAKPGKNQYIFGVDLRHLDILCVRKRFRMESLTRRSTSNEERRLHVLLRPEGRVLYAGIRSKVT